MKLTNKHKIDTQFSMSSMTDIVFLLLIFFMLTVSSVTNQGLPVDLPQSNNADTLTPQVNVTITADLHYYINEQKIKKEQLKERLKQKLDKNQPLVLVQIDKSVPVAHMIYVTDIAAALQAKVSVATQPD
ncbi:MAG: biopolymer transporter ExbD [Bacteroidota bacterium]